VHNVTNILQQKSGMHTEPRDNNRTTN